MWPRIPSLPSADFDILIPGIIVSSKTYDVDFFVDVNTSGTYDFPPDHTWRLPGLPGTTTGLETTFTHNTAFNEVCESFDACPP